MSLHTLLRRLSVSSRRHSSLSPSPISSRCTSATDASTRVLVSTLSFDTRIIARRRSTFAGTTTWSFQSDFVRRIRTELEKGKIKSHRNTTCVRALLLNKSIWPDLHLSGFRAAHSIASDDDDEEGESGDFDDFLMESDAKKCSIRKPPSAVYSKNRKVKIYKTETQEEEDDDDKDESDVPIRAAKRKRSSFLSFGDELEESDLSEDEKKKLVSSSQAKARRSEDCEDTNGRRKDIKFSIESLELSSDEEAEKRSSESESRADPGQEPTKDDSGANDTASGGPSYLTKTRFDKFDISPFSIKALHSVLKYERMTEVQEATFPVILKGQDVLAKARTGTGKTIAFLLPAIEAVLKASEGRSRNPINVLIVCPTRELAQQAANEAQVLLKFHRGLGAQVVYGGNSIRTEQMNLSRNPCQILVGTPGRLVDHIQRTPELGRQLRSVRMFVLDEADHMLDMGFRDSLRKIMEAIPSQRQTLLFSATIPKEVHSMSKVALRDDHVFIDAVGKNSQDTHIKVKQQYIVVPLEKQLRVLYAALRQHMSEDPQYKVLVFCTTARVTAFMCKLFSNLGFNSREIHSRKDQRYRTRISDEFRQSKGGIILFTSDVSARGVDYPNVTLVVQVGAPSDLEQYIHRLGRTGRAGKKGEGLLILAPWEDYFLQKLESKKLPITLMPPPKLTSQAKIKILSTAGRIDFDIREPAYQAWLGYYKSLKGITLDKAKLVQYANQFSASMGFEEPPALSRMLISKLNLTGVPGIRVSR